MNPVNVMVICLPKFGDAVSKNFHRHEDIFTLRIFIKKTYMSLEITLIHFYSIDICHIKLNYKFQYRPNKYIYRHTFLLKIVFISKFQCTKCTFPGCFENSLHILFLLLVMDVEWGENFLILSDSESSAYASPDLENSEFSYNEIDPSLHFLPDENMPTFSILTVSVPEPYDHNHYSIRSHTINRNA
ncbi:hypothetical protein TRFO_10776 [Tritrichomonas foetus]|uniref:Uncharacterized protein n=1 Tax=Tritrichomonas foetus TaxID=1144522 RepID=A0A1J4JC74_9EUKA|nr:hypothetical protein TRFO_10776 [Tritrichomonas foetus]|eukprot:OHS94860.1 hypothetical protein TRFO_10776 [Tritrichomonas foetus]